MLAHWLGFAILPVVNPIFNMLLEDDHDRLPYLPGLRLGDHPTGCILYLDRRIMGCALRSLIAAFVGFIVGYLLALESRDVDAWLVGALCGIVMMAMSIFMEWIMTTITGDE